MEQYVIREIEYLGKVKFDKGLSLGTIDAALEKARQTAANEKAAVFTNHVLSAMLVEPSKTSAEVANLPENVMNALVKVAADLLDIQEDFEKASSDLEARERFYQAYLGWFDRTIGSALRGIAQQAQAVFTNALAPPEFKFPIPKIEIPLPRLSKSAFAPLVKSLQALASDFSTQIQESLQGLSGQFVQLGEAVQQRLDAAKLDAQVVAPLLAQANLWISPSAPLSLLDALKQIVGGGEATPKAVEELFLGYYRSNECAPLRQMVLSWENNPHFRDRMPIIQDALEAHINNKFTLSVPALLPHVEGVASNILGIPIPYGTGGHIRGLLERGFTEFIHSASKDILIEYVTRVVYEGVGFEDFAAAVREKGYVETDFLHRPAILHGMHLNYANEGLSLRVFLLLDALSTI